MKIKEMILIADALETIQEMTDTTMPDLIDALIGLAWDEEDACTLKLYNSEEDD